MGGRKWELLTGWTAGWTAAGGNVSNKDRGVAWLGAGGWVLVCGEGEGRHASSECASRGRERRFS